MSFIDTTQQKLLSISGSCQCQAGDCDKKAQSFCPECDYKPYCAEHHNEHQKEVQDKESQMHSMISVVQFARKIKEDNQGNRQACTDHLKALQGKKEEIEEKLKLLEEDRKTAKERLQSEKVTLGKQLDDFISEKLKLVEDTYTEEHSQETNKTNDIRKQIKTIEDSLSGFNHCCENEEVLCKARLDIDRMFQGIQPTLDKSTDLEKYEPESVRIGVQAPVGDIPEKYFPSMQIVRGGSILIQEEYKRKVIFCVICACAVLLISFLVLFRIYFGGAEPVKVSRPGVCPVRQYWEFVWMCEMKE